MFPSSQNDKDDQHSKRKVWAKMAMIFHRSTAQVTNNALIVRFTRAPIHTGVQTKNPLIRPSHAIVHLCNRNSRARKKKKKKKKKKTRKK